MGFSTSAATAVIFVGVLIAMSVLIPATQNTFERVSDALDDRDGRLLALRNTDFAIVDAVYNTSATNDTLIVRAENVGSVSLTVNETDLLVDGRIVVDPNATVEGTAGRTTWLPGEQLAFRTTNETAPDRVTVVGDRGVTRSNDTVRGVS